MMSKKLKKFITVFIAVSLIFLFAGTASYGLDYSLDVHGKNNCIFLDDSVAARTNIPAGDYIVKVTGDAFYLDNYSHGKVFIRYASAEHASKDYLEALTIGQSTVLHLRDGYGFYAFFADWSNLDDNSGTVTLEFYEIITNFTDVPPGFWAEDAIYKIYEAGITTGCSKNPLMYCPENPVKRDQMAVFLGRAEHGSKFIPPDATGIFADVPKWYWAADWIEQFYVDGLTKGCKTDPHDAQSPVIYYCPKYPVTRTTMAIFLLRAKHGANYQPPAATGIFGDVGVNYWAADWIEQLYREGITTGCKKKPLMYCPSNHVTRAQMAVFLARMLGL